MFFVETCPAIPVEECTAKMLTAEFVRFSDISLSETRPFQILPGNTANRRKQYWGTFLRAIPGMSRSLLYAADTASSV